MSKELVTCKKCGKPYFKINMYLDPRTLSLNKQDFYCKDCYKKKYPKKFKEVRR